MLLKKLTKKLALNFLQSLCFFLTQVDLSPIFKTQSFVKYTYNISYIDTHTHVHTHVHVM